MIPCSRLYRVCHRETSMLHIFIDSIMGVFAAHCTCNLWWVVVLLAWIVAHLIVEMKVNVIETGAMTVLWILELSQSSDLLQTFAIANLTVSV